MVLLRLERWLDRTVTSALARAFPSPLDVVELESALRRDCDAKAAVIHGGRQIVPNEFAIDLSPRDYRALHSDETIDRLRRSLNDHVTKSQYTLAGPIAVELYRKPSRVVGVPQIRSTALTPTAMNPETSPVRVVVGTRRIGVPEGTFSIGRADSMSLRLDDVGVSRHHCDISRSPQALTIHDRSSTNGTIVNGVPVTSGHLVNGDVIRVGTTEIVIEVSA